MALILSIRKIRKGPLLLAALVCCAIILAAGYALLRTPAWYDLPKIPVEQRQSVRNNLLAAEQAMTEGLRSADGPFVFHLYQEDVNRWIAMRREIYPLIDELAPPELIDPIILFEPGEITLAGRYRLGILNVVVSIDLAAEWTDNQIVLRLKAIRCGSSRIPTSLVHLGLDHTIDRPPDALWPGSPRVQGNLQSGLLIDARAWWKNGGVNYRVRGLDVRYNQLSLTIEPLGPHSPRKRKDQD